MTRLIRKAIWAWQDWRRLKRIPSIREGRQELLAARRGHKATRTTFTALRGDMTELLRG